MSQAAVDIDNYLFRYDFSSGTKKFCGSAEFAVDPLSDTKLGSSDRADLKVFPVEGPDGANSAVHPSNTGWTAGSSSANSTTVYNLLSNGDWTLAICVRPGTTANGVLFSAGRRSVKERKGISICASSNPNEMIVDENISNGSNTRSQRSRNVLNNGVDVSRGFHTVVVVYRKPASGNAGTAEFYIDGVFQKSITTANYVFGGGFQFCSSMSGLQNEVATSGDLDVAFRDVRFYAAAFSSSDVRRYAALHPAGTLRKSAFVRAYGVNSINTGYLPKHTMRIAADFQFTELSSQYRIFGSAGVEGNLWCFFYCDASERFARCLHDYGTGWGNMGVAAGNGRGFVVLDGPDNSAKLYYNGVLTSTNCGGVPTQDSSSPLALFASNGAAEYGSTEYKSKSLIYSVGIDEDGTPVHFFAPHNDETLGACFKDVITGELKGESEDSPSTALSYSDGFGSSADYKYENGTLYAKVYVDAVNTAQGTVSVAADGAALTPEADGSYWVAYGTTLTLAATPANEYLFDGWAGDMRAVASGAAADATLTVKVDKALQFEARFTPSAIRHTTLLGDFAKRAQDFDVGDYVQTGLVLHFDGKRNAGAGAAHSDDATTWANLGTLGSANDATLSTLGSNIPSGATDGAWGENGYNFGGKNYFAIPAATLGGALTVQVAADYKDDDQLVLYPAFFGQTSSNTDNFMVYFNRNNGDDAAHKTLRFKLLNKTAHGATSVWSGPFATAIYDSSRDASQGVSVGDAILPQWQKRNASGDIPSYTYAIGTTKYTDAERGAYRMFVGTVKSVRVYMQVLGDDALVWNRFVDDVRFRDGGVDVDFVVAANPRGLEGVEPAGDYMVNGSHTFTATNLTNGVFTWSPAGYTLEKWDSDSRTWKFVYEGAGSSYTYVNSKANGKMRLSWIWEQTGAVKGGYEPGDYVQNGLLLHFDGIRNAGADAPHSNDATTWANLGSLGGGKNATLMALASSIPSGATDGTWGENGYRFGGQNYFAIGGTVALGGALTVQIAADYNDADQVVDYPSFFGQISEDHDYFGVYFNRKRSGDLKTTPYFKLLDTTAHGAKSVWAGPFATAIYDTSRTDGVSIGDETLPQWQKRNPSGNIPAYSYAIGGAWKSDSERGAYRMFVGTVKSVRVYNRVLPDFALEHNRAVDEVRFLGNVTVVNGAVGETGEIGASSAADGVYDISSGTWTITAPTVKVDGKTYSPKLLIETFNAATGAWTADGAIPVWAGSYTIDKSVIGDARIRLVWTWEKKSGLVIIAR